MAIVRFVPASGLQTMFNTFFDTPTTARWGGVLPQQWLPPTDLIETEDHYLLRADLPGLSEADVSVELQDQVLTISGERKFDQVKGNWVRVERGFGSFSRSLTLPEGIDPAQVRASFDRGVLEVWIPKPEQRKPYAVQISTTSTAAPEREMIEA